MDVEIPVKREEIEEEEDEVQILYIRKPIKGDNESEQRGSGNKENGQVL